MKLLLADDHLLFIEAMKYLLNYEFQIRIEAFAKNGREAVEKCKEANIDTVLMDINMPVVNGIEATKLIKQLYPYIKVIIISTFDDMQTITQALKAGADAYILKDEGSDGLIAAFKTISRNEIFISPSVAHLFTAEKNKSKTMEKCVQFAENLITPREQSILKLICEGYTNQQIADTLFIAVATADTHRKNILTKLKLNNTAALVRFAVENKLV